MTFGLQQPLKLLSVFPFPKISLLKDRLKGSEKMITRFAPSVTGHLHMGHILHAIYIWGIAKAVGGEVIIRLEDHDKGRWRPEYETSILADLEWLGFLQDTSTAKVIFRQSKREEKYREVFEKLNARNLIYACSCSRKEILESTSGQSHQELFYPGTCREKKLSAKGGVGMRVKLERQKIEFSDLLLGRQIQVPANQCGDLLVRDRQGNWTYQFAASVDDWDMGINLVIRGEDLLTSTGRQVQLMKLWGATEPPKYLHHPLLRDENGEKLSKRLQSEPIRNLREKGALASEILGQAAIIAGLQKLFKPLHCKEVLEACYRQML